MPRLRFDLKKSLDYTDPRETPTYNVAEAAHYLRLPAATLRAWVLGRQYPTGKGKRTFAPLIKIADRERRLLSFVNLAEAHVLSACRRIHGLPFHRLRPALDYVSAKFNSQHPLVAKEFATDGVRLFIHHLGELIDVTAQGQIVMRSVVEQYLERLEREGPLVVRLYPFTRDDPAVSPRSVFIDPRFSFGRPVLAKARVPTASIAERYWAGETIEALSSDYDCETFEIQEAIRCEGRPAAAA